MATGEKSKQKDAIGRLATRGEATLHRLTEIPGSTKALKAFNDLRERVDDLGKKVRGIDKLEARVTRLEKELAAVKRAQKPAASKSSAPRKRPAA